jgi:arylformamidase
MCRIYDLSPLISPRLAVWPGDTSLWRERLLDCDRGDHITLSTIHATVHLGSHADAHLHFAARGQGIEAHPLEDYIGACQVIRVAAPPRGKVQAGHLGCEIVAERVLLATGTYPDPEHFRDDFASLDPRLVDTLHERGVRLVGIDTPSVDPFSSHDLPAHQRFLAHRMSLLEGLVLSHVPEGTYELIALPLRLEGFDASPVRAILRSRNSNGESP